MASQSNRNVIALLALCESCAVSVRNYDQTNYIGASEILSDILNKLEQAAQQARKGLPSELTKKEAANISDSMRKADSTNPFINDSQPESTIFYTSLALGLLDELLGHVRDMHKVEHLERVESAIWNLHRYFDNGLDQFATYEKATRAVPIWLECLNE